MEPRSHPWNEQTIENVTAGLPPSAAFVGVNAQDFASRAEYYDAVRRLLIAPDVPRSGGNERERLAHREYELGLDLAHDGQLEEACSAYRVALKLGPGGNGPYVIQYSLGRALDELERHEEALAAFDRAAAGEGSGRLRTEFLVWIQEWRARDLLLLGRLDDALEAYDHVAVLEPGGRAEGLRGSALTHLGRWEEALVAYDRSIAADPDNAALHRSRATVLMVLGRNDDARTAIGRSLTIDPADAAAKARTGQILVQLGNWDEAVEACNDALDVDPECREAHRCRNEALLLAGRYEDVRTGRALQGTDHIMDLIVSAVADLAAGDVDSAAAGFAEAVDVDEPVPWTGRFEQSRCIALAGAHRVDEAVERLEALSADCRFRLPVRWFDVLVEIGLEGAVRLREAALLPPAAPSPSAVLVHAIEMTIRGHPTHLIDKPTDFAAVWVELAKDRGIAPNAAALVRWEVLPVFPRPDQRYSLPWFFLRPLGAPVLGWLVRAVRNRAEPGVWKTPGFYGPGKGAKFGVFIDESARWFSTSGGTHNDAKLRNLDLKDPLVDFGPHRLVSTRRATREDGAGARPWRRIEVPTFERVWTTPKDARPDRMLWDTERPRQFFDWEKLLLGMGALLGLAKVDDFPPPLSSSAALELVAKYSGDSGY